MSRLPPSSVAVLIGCARVPPERILIVDDDESIRQIVRLCLSDEGYEVFEADNGLTGLAAVEQVLPSLILLDLRMPVMSGWEFARRYRAGPAPHAPLIAFVAALNAEEECADLEADAILSKPFDLDELLEAVRAHLPIVT
jgi:two-component system chemotaxis response regulator CheY